MAFLAINGIELDVLNDTCSEEKREIGATDMAFDGTMKKQRQSTKYDLKFETPPMISATAFAWDSLIRGHGQRWSFDSHLYGSKGLGPTSSTGCTNETTNGAKWGAKYLQITAGNSFAVAGVYSSDVTTLVHKWNSGIAEWEHYIIIGNAATVYLDGVSSGASIAAWFSASGGTVTLGGAAGHDFDDLVILPFAVPTAWVTAANPDNLFYWHSLTSAWPDLPRLSVSGDVLWDVSPRTMIGSSDVSTLLKGVVGGSFRTNARKLSVYLQQT